MLLIIINALVGGLVGMERSILPDYADKRFSIESNSTVLGFIIVFGLSKALTNYFTGKFSNRFGRKNLLLTGWLFALPFPFLLIYAEDWSWVILANVLLGINQGLTWSSTVVMKIDLVGEKDRGFAMGLNEFSGYLAVGVFAYLSAYIADKFGVDQYPFYLGILLSFIGLLLSLFLVRDTQSYVNNESHNAKIKKSTNVFIDTTLKNKTLSSVTQAGFVNNLNDGMIWGLLPVYLAGLQFDLKTIGLIVGIYPVVWGISQLITGKMGDIIARKKLLVIGMLLQGISIVLFLSSNNTVGLSFVSALMGIGTALVYPTFLALIADVSHPDQRAESLGVFRLWRDLGYAFGAIISGVIADLLGIEYAILFIGLLTIVSGLIVQFRIP